MENIKVLVVDDDPLVCEMISKMLKMSDFQPFSATSGEKGLRELYRLQPDIMILDIMMPGMDGLEVLKRTRQITDVPIIVLSALTQTDVTVRALELGADDYVKKPFEKEELLARIGSVLRRSTATQTGPLPMNYDDGYLAINLDENRVWIDGQPLRLTVTEFKLLECLSLNCGQICTYPQILDYVWGGAAPNRAEYIHVYVWKLRNKIERDANNPEYLITEHGVGYRFEKKKTNEIVPRY
jgi:two-component system, OmpR family, KDP operon response regulator KdpE